jgi:exosome complex component RRP42
VKIMELSDVIWEVKKESTKRMVMAGKRPDKRAFEQYRPLEFQPDYIPRAEGSCLVRLGDTVVLVGVKMDIGEPYPDRPDKGTMITNCELAPMASPAFTAGPPREESIETARVVDRGIRESGTIDFDKLCVVPGEKVWTALIDIHVLDHHGNLIDAASLAAVKALHMARFPKVEDDKIIYDEKEGQLPINDKPVSSTFVKIGDKLLLDPVLEEEKAMEARLTLVSLESDNLCAMQKAGIGSLTAQEIDNMADIAIARGKELRKLI